MYGSVLVFLIAIAIQALAPRSVEPSWSAVEVAHQVLYPLAAWAALRIRFRGLMARALHNETAARELRAGFSGTVQAYQGVMLVPFALLQYATHYPGLVSRPLGAHSAVLGSAAGVLPFILLLCVLWWESYPLQGVLFGRSGTRAGFVRSHGRMEFPVLVPWLALMGLLDVLAELWPAGYAALEGNPLLQLLYAPVFLVLVGIFLPVLVKVMWGCEPVPPGPLRDRLEGLCARLGLQVREFLYWPLLEGRVMTAGIVGLLPHFRYLLLTPALVELLSPEEIEGVVAHETGHVRHRHLWFYLLFFVGYVCLAAIFFRISEAAFAWWGTASPEVLRQPQASLYTSAAMTVGLLALLFAYFRLLFGAVSRAFERQADAYALEATGRPGPLVSALERVSFHSGDIRDLPSWHHGSIAERVDFLLSAARNPRLLEAHHRRVRRLTALFVLGTLGAAGLAVALHTDPLDRGLQRFVAERGLLHRVSQAPEDASSWFLLGSLYQEVGKESQAESAYLEALRLSPRHPQALNNLAWLYVTSREPGRYRPERALALAELAAATSRSPYILDTLAEARWRTYDRQGALEAIDEALARNPENRGYYLGQRQKFLTESPRP
ncbi:MAG: M48 family metalloprotease [Deferrisomatales bacterium]|nr:M48 family metalloprotease [Deferrisomatales bacterium]